jgi:hypothetical protein
MTEFDLLRYLLLVCRSPGRQHGARSRKRHLARLRQPPVSDRSSGGPPALKPKFDSCDKNRRSVVPDAPSAATTSGVARTQQYPDSAGPASGPPALGRPQRVHIMNGLRSPGRNCPVRKPYIQDQGLNRRIPKMCCRRYISAHDRRGWRLANALILQQYEAGPLHGCHTVAPMREPLLRYLSLSVNATSRI